MDDNKSYAAHMLWWLDRLDVQEPALALTSLEEVRQFWSMERFVDIQAIQVRLWAWVDENGGPRINTNKDMLFVRMVLCLTSEDNRELEDKGFFEDLLTHWGFSRAEISAHGPTHIPARGP